MNAVVETEISRTMPSHVLLPLTPQAKSACEPTVVFLFLWHGTSGSGSLNPASQMERVAERDDVLPLHFPVQDPKDWQSGSIYFVLRSGL